MIAASAVNDGALGCDPLEVTAAKRSGRTVPHRPTDIPHPQRYKTVSRSRQNRGRNRSRGRPSTLLPGCDGFATPREIPDNRLGFYLFALNGPLSRRAAATDRLSVNSVPRWRRSSIAFSKASGLAHSRHSPNKRPERTDASWSSPVESCRAA